MILGILGIILMAALLFLAAISIIFCIKENEDVFLIPFIFIAAFLIFWGTVATIPHASDIAKIRTGDSFISVQREAIKEIDAQLSEINVPGALLNADTPVASYIKTKADYIKNITETKLEIERAKRSIISRGYGLNAWTVWVMGDGAK